MLIPRPTQDLLNQNPRSNKILGASYHWLRGYIFWSGLIPSRAGYYGVTSGKVSKSWKLAFFAVQNNTPFTELLWELGRYKAFCTVPAHNIQLIIVLYIVSFAHLQLLTILHIPFSITEATRQG